METENLINASKELKNELATMEYTGSQRKAFLAGFIRNKAIFSISGSNVAQIILKTELSNIAKICLNTLKKDLKIENTRVIYENRTKFGKKTIYTIISKGNILEILKDLEYKDDLIDMLPDKMLKNNYIKSYTSGLFCATGSLSNPVKSYHFEISFDDEEIAKTIADKFNNLYKTNKDVNQYNFKIIERRNKYVLYMKNSENISNFLSFLGAITSMYSFENARIENDYLNSDNRLNQCLMYNYQRTLKASNKIVQKLEKIIDTPLFNELDEKTKTIVKCKMQNKDSSYKELVDILKEQGVSTSKTGVYNAIKKAEKLV